MHTLPYIWTIPYTGKIFLKAIRYKLFIIKVSFVEIRIIRIVWDIRDAQIFAVKTGFAL